MVPDEDLANLGLALGGVTFADFERRFALEKRRVAAPRQYFWMTMAWAATRCRRAVFRVKHPRQYFWMTMAFATTRQRTPRHVFWMTTAANQSDGRWSTP